MSQETKMSFETSPLADLSFEELQNLAIAAQGLTKYKKAQAEYEAKSAEEKKNQRKKDWKSGIFGKLGLFF